ncbi:aldose 1-epimerase family protein, partial [Rhizobium ruizarguesonis]
ITTAGIAPSDAAAASGLTNMHFHFENLPNLALWTKQGAPFLCIEPWHGTAAEAGGSSEISKRPSTTILAPGAVASFSFTVEIP